MSVEALEIRVGADMDKAIKAFSELRKQLNAAAQQGGDAMQKLVQGFKQVDDGAETAADGIAGLSNEVKKAIPSWQQLNTLFQGIFAKKFGQGEGLKVMSDWNKELKAGTITFEQFIQRLNLSEQEMTQVTAKMKGMGLAAAGLHAPMKAAGNAAAGAQMTLLNFNRVIQDAPYGIMGIANNIDPLVASFQQLKRETGSASGAFSAMASSLAGGAGIAIAVSLVTSLLVKYGDEIIKAFQSTENMTAALAVFSKAADEAGEAIDNLQGQVEQLNRVAKIDLQVRFDDQSEVELFDLRGQSVLNRDTISKIEVEVAKLRQNMSNALEFALNKGSRKLAEAIDNDTLEYVIEELKEKDQKLGKAYLATVKAFEEGNKKLTEAQNRQQVIENEIRLNKREAERDEAKEAEKAAEKRKAQRDKELKAQQKYLEDLRKVQEELRTIYRKIAMGAVDFNAVPAIAPKKDYQKEFAESLRQQFEKGIDVPIPINFTPQQAQDELWNRSMDDVLTDYMVQFRNLDLKFPKLDMSKFADPEELGKHLERVKEFAQQAREIMVQMGEDIAIGIGEGLGTVLTGGSITEAFSGIFNSIGSALKRLGAVMITTSKLMEKFKKAFSAMNTTGQLVAGIAMVAMGQVIQQAARSAAPFANGGIVSGPTYGLVGEYAGAKHNPEVIAPLNKLKELIQPTSAAFPQYLPAQRIEGSTLLMWYQRASNINGRYS